MRSEKMEGGGEIEMKMQRLDAPSRLRRAWHCGAGAGRSYRPHRLPVLAITNLRIFIAFIKCVN